MEKIMEDLNKKREFNYGIALLRTLMCFEVVLCHFWTTDVPKVLMPFSVLRGLAVPVFMFLSFFLTEHTFLEYNKNKAKKRIWRVIYPQIGWALIYWLGYTIAQFIFKDIDVKFSDLWWQMFTGHSPRLNASMWFQTVLIVLTAIYIFIFKFFIPKKGILITYVMMFVAFVIQYSGINFKLFDSLRYELKYPLGRFCEMIPYATVGFSCAYYNAFEKAKKTRLFSTIMFGLASVFLLEYSFINSALGFGYSTNNCLLLGFFVIGFAYLIPLEKLPQKVKNILKFLTQYTLGIYCMHRIIADFLKLIFSKLDISIDSFLLCIITYICGFFVSFLMYKIPTKFFKQLVN